MNIGDKIRCVKSDEGNWYKIGQEFVIRSQPFVDKSDDAICYLIEEQPDNKIWIQGDHFELVKEEENMPARAELKKNWSIACHNEDTFNAIISLCKVLGYPISEYAEFSKSWMAVGPSNVRNEICMVIVKERHFESIEGFINWHFKPEEPELTEEQKEILELEKVIQSCKDQIEEASLRVKKLKEMKK